MSEWNSCWPRVRVRGAARDRPPRGRVARGAAPVLPDPSRPAVGDRPPRFRRSGRRGSRRRPTAARRRAASWRRWAGRTSRYALECRGMFELMFRHDLLDGREARRACRGCGSRPCRCSAGSSELVARHRTAGQRGGAGTPRPVTAAALWANVHGIAQLWAWGSLGLALRRGHPPPAGRPARPARRGGHRRPLGPAARVTGHVSSATGGQRGRCDARRAGRHRADRGAARAADVTSARAWRRSSGPAPATCSRWPRCWSSPGGSATGTAIARLLLPACSVSGRPRPGSRSPRRRLGDRAAAAPGRVRRAPSAGDAGAAAADLPGGPARHGRRHPDQRDRRGRGGRAAARRRRWSRIWAGAAVFVVNVPGRAGDRRARLRGAVPAGDGPAPAPDDRGSTSPARRCSRPGSPSWSTPSSAYRRAGGPPRRRCSVSGPPSASRRCSSARTPCPASDRAAVVRAVHGGNGVDDDPAGHHRRHVRRAVRGHVLPPGRARARPVRQRPAGPPADRAHGPRRTRGRRRAPPVRPAPHRGRGHRPRRPRDRGNCRGSARSGQSPAWRSPCSAPGSPP